jgi:SAM-dependent methyltransferase
VPPILKLLPRPLRALGKRAYYRGGARFCPVCERSVRRFLCAGNPSRPDARCPLCQSLERHRLVWRFFETHTDLFEPRRKRMLHIAPEPELEARLRCLGHLDYVTADLHDPRAMVRMDVSDIAERDGAYDVIYCSHVLEHVLDDRRAMRELCRVLKPGGWSVLNVPITAERTVEDPSITDPAERERLFGQADHVRRYGSDYIDRLRAAGFEVRAFRPEEVLGAEDMRRLAVPCREQVFFCTRPLAPRAALHPGERAESR